MRATAQSIPTYFDLPELARTPVAVVCAGAKAILDLPKTLEVLETLGQSDPPRGRVEAGGHLVEEDDPGVVDQCQGDEQDYRES